MRQPIPRVEPDKPLMTVDEAVAADRAFFDAHPDQDEYIREFVPGKFGKAELPEIPAGFRYATHVSVMLRVDDEPVGRYRQLDDDLQHLIRISAGCYDLG
jgi:hypothetical protein